MEYSQNELSGKETLNEAVRLVDEWKKTAVSEKKLDKKFGDFLRAIQKSDGFVAQWSSSRAGADGVPYQYDNGPWPKEDGFIQFCDGSVLGYGKADSGRPFVHSYPVMELPGSIHAEQWNKIQEAIKAEFSESNLSSADKTELDIKTDEAQEAIKDLGEFVKTEGFGAAIEYCDQSARALSGHGYRQDVWVFAEKQLKKAVEEYPGLMFEKPKARGYDTDTFFGKSVIEELQENYPKPRRPDLGEHEYESLTFSEVTDCAKDLEMYLKAGNVRGAIEYCQEESRRLLDSGEGIRAGVYEDAKDLLREFSERQDQRVGFSVVTGRNPDGGFEITYTGSAYMNYEQIPEILESACNVREEYEFKQACADLFSGEIISTQNEFYDVYHEILTEVVKEKCPTEKRGECFHPDIVFDAAYDPSYMPDEQRDEFNDPNLYASAQRLANRGKDRSTPFVLYDKEGVKVEVELGISNYESQQSVLRISGEGETHEFDLKGSTAIKLIKECGNGGEYDRSGTKYAAPEIFKEKFIGTVLSEDVAIHEEARAKGDLLSFASDARTRLEVLTEVQKRAGERGVGDEVSMRTIAGAVASLEHTASRWNGMAQVAFNVTNSPMALFNKLTEERRTAQGTDLGQKVGKARETERTRPLQPHELPQDPKKEWPMNRPKPQGQGRDGR